MTYMRGTLEERFWPRVDKDGPISEYRPDLGACWVWIGAHLQSGGYGCICGIGPSGKWQPLRAHRVAYEMLVGPVPEGLVLDHLCRVVECVNPAHLEPVTRKENTRRGMAPNMIVNRTGRCRRGHERTPANSYERLDRPGQWNCRACRSERESVDVAGGAL